MLKFHSPFIDVQYTGSSSYIFQIVYTIFALIIIGEVHSLTFSTRYCITVSTSALENFVIFVFLF